ncbi:zinc finger C2H2 type domain-containing protein [Fusarium napiforme]|uniref:Zinc finger C2H2 type domain-containing protein n=1 Tax=Fusarium napiforme TaxID=42672 RepID=A0A8H5IBE9_9HYPO|nr:zinc finger C2H2 type domain-containing protein [Fusarium napiforme]
MSDNRPQHCCPICSAEFTKSGMPFETQVFDAVVLTNDVASRPPQSAFPVASQPCNACAEQNQECNYVQKPRKDDLVSPLKVKEDKKGHELLPGQDIQVQGGSLFLSQHDWISDSTPVTSFDPVLLVQAQPGSESDVNSSLMSQSGSHLPQGEWSVSHDSPLQLLVTPRPTFPRMRLRFLVRLTSSHGLANSFNCDNIFAGTKTHSGLLQHDSRPSFESVAIPETAVASPWATPGQWPHPQQGLTGQHSLANICEQIVRGISHASSQASESNWSSPRKLSCSRFFSPGNVELFLTLFFQIWHPNWPVFHRPTFDPTVKSPKLIVALSLIGAFLSTERKHRDQAMIWLETAENWIFQDPNFSEASIAQTDDEGQDSEVRQRLDILQAAYGILLLMNWEGDTKMRLRARRTRFTDIVFVSRTLYPFAIPGTSEEASFAPRSLHDHWTSFGLREELIRTLLYTFLLDSAFVIFYDMSPRMVINELQFGLAAADEHFNAPDAETWFMCTQAAAQRSLACSQITLSQSITMFMGEDFGTSRWGIFEIISPLNLFAIASAFHNLLYHHQNGPDPRSRSLPITRGLRNWFRVWSSHNLFSTPGNDISVEASGSQRKLGFFLHADEYWCLANLFCSQLERGVNPHQSFGETHSQRSGGLSDMDKIHSLILRFQDADLGEVVLS